ncbi:ABC transporter substrate-binding protein [Salipiger sp. 1_MG-2023]|uniref:ABC transporter substrate-binding protein n=1 Tax=Salipiger sp. 1_MG-2023 TaxID=3062665 RepID=UPI0026E12C06|nr:ABC transporter substrate-binding protein [Salipiger sp. 1_MG-2023]MDO6584612.1 ABC transporter substrate-binding protein [Salipiger sp. 1_MG-2023]
MSLPQPRHPLAQLHARELAEGRLTRREFLTRVTALGVPVAGAYALGGLPAPARADETAETEGTTLRIQMEVRALKDPRTADWSEIANIYRGWLEYLVEYNSDGSVRGMLLDRWEVSDDALTYTLHLRPGVRWNNGDAFTAEDVARMFRYWCDREVAGNSMAGRLVSLVDHDTGQLRDGAVTVIDPLTVTLTLQSPDVALMVGLSDYPAAVVHANHDPLTMLDNPLGTGPYLPEALDPGVRALLVRNTNHDWWGARTEGFGGATLDAIEFIDYGTDPASWLAAAEAGEIDMMYENIGDFIALADALGWQRSEVTTGSTVVLRGSQIAKLDGRAPYADARVRKAIQLAIDNEIALELGYSGHGIVAENHHVAPVHPDYAAIGPTAYDPDAALALMVEAGMEDFAHELVTLDDGLTMRTGDACAAMLRDAGLKVKRTVLPGARFWAEWKSYPLSITEWNHRPLGIQMLALAYRSGEPWNESGYANHDFDVLVGEALGIAEAEARRDIMARLEAMLQQDAVIVQPYWRSLYRHVRPGVTGAEMHPAFEIHLYKLGLRP